MKKKISVIVPVYKTEKYLPRCLDSICGQSYPHLEIIVIDDGSPDNAGAICDEYAKKDNRIRVLHKENAGVSSARNDGLEISTGDYVTFVDSDDYIAPNMYETLVAMIESEDADISICGFAKENEIGKFESYWKEMIKCSLSQIDQLKCLLSNRYYCCSCWEMLFKRQCLSGIRFDISKKYNEDLLFIYEAMKNSKKAIYTSEPLYYYCNNQESVTHYGFNDSMMDIIFISEYIYGDIKKSFPEITKFEMCQFMRNNISCAAAIVRQGYNNAVSIDRIRNNIKENVINYLSSDAALGYKIYASLISLNWKAFDIYIKMFDGR